MIILQDTIIKIGIFDDEARRNSTFTADDMQDVSNPSQLRMDDLEFQKYATLEQNFFILDGSFNFLPSEKDWGWWKHENGVGWWSKSMTGDNGKFQVPPTLEIDTLESDKLYSTTGLTITFLEDFPLELSIDWYGESGVLINHAVFQPDSLRYFCPAKVENFRRVVLTFTKASPYRYVKVQSVEYGKEYVWSGDKVISAKVLEEVDPISSEISINTLDFELHSDAKEFDLFSSNSLLSVFSDNQKIEVVQVMDEEEIQMGTFYLDTWKNGNEDTGIFFAISPVGILEQSNFNGDIYVAKKAGDIIDEIMDSAGWEDYEIDESLKGVELSGWIPICTHREALQQVAFALCAIVEDNRGNTIRIHKNLRSYGWLIPRDRKFAGGTLTLDSYISEIAVTAHDYVLSDKTEEVWSGVVADGTYKVEFNAPCTNVSEPAAPFEDEKPCANCQYVRFFRDPPTTQKESITGNKYEDSTTLFYVWDKGRGKGETLAVTDATLVSRDNMEQVANHLMKYYKQRYQSSLEFIIEKETAGERVAIQSADGKSYQIFTILSMDIDLVGGFIAKAEMVSDGKNLVSENYTGEFYAGERGLI